MRRLAAALLASAAAAGAAQAPLRLDLRGAVRMAGEKQVAVLVAVERVRQAIERQAQARSVLLPQLAASASGSRQIRNLEAQGIELPGRDPLVGPFNTFDARLTLVMPLFDGAAYERLRQVRAGRALSESEAAKARQDAMALVGSLYLHARRARDSERLAQALVRLGEARGRIARARSETGSGSAVDSTQADADLAVSRQRLTAAREEEAERRRDLAAALGLDAAAPLELAEGEETLPVILPPAGGPEAALAGHPDLEAARRLERQRELERRAEQADAWPKAALAADYGASGKAVDDSVGTWSVGARVSVPLFEGGRRPSRVGEAESRRRESELSAQDAERRVAAEIASAADAATEAGEAVRAREADHGAAREQLSLAQSRLAGGSGTALEVEEVRAREALAADALTAARSLRLAAQLRLARSLGRMDEVAGKE